LRNNFLIFLFSFAFIALPAHSHTFTGMVGFYDGLSHPVLGMDHFLAMVSVGIISALIGGRAIWFVPSIFVSIMILGGILGISSEIYKGLDGTVVELDQMGSLYYFADQIAIVIEYGIILSVILLGLSIAIEKKLPIFITSIFIGIFGFCHGTAHGLEMPWAVNPILFALGFVSGTTILHLFGVGIGHYSLKSKLSSLILRIVGLACAFYGIYLVFSV